MCSTPTPMLGLARQRAVSSGQAHLTLPFVFAHIAGVDAGDNIVSLGPIHAGCFELYATDRIQGIRDLKGKTVGVYDLGGAGQLFVASMAAYVGLDASRDISWAVPNSTAEALQLFSTGAIDAYTTFPPRSYDFRASGLGHVVVNSMRDRPWSQYSCCSVTMNRACVQLYPVATKRALRAVLQASDFCAREPERVARMLADRFPDGADYGRELQTLQEIPYGHWREFDPDDTTRFYSLRLREANMIHGSPQEMIARGTDWSFLNALKKELWPTASRRAFFCSLSGGSSSIEV